MDMGDPQPEKNKMTNMAQPQPKAKPVYKHRLFAGIYKVVYHAPSGARRQGIPHDDKNDIITMELTGGNSGAPKTIVTSLFDFEENFFEYDPLKVAKAEGEIV